MEPQNLKAQEDKLQGKDEADPLTSDDRVWPYQLLMIGPNNCYL